MMIRSKIGIQDGTGGETGTPVENSILIEGRIQNENWHQNYSRDRDRIEIEFEMESELGSSP